MGNKKNYVYILKCAGGKLYTGWTNDLKKRVQAHQEGKGGKFTRANRPVELVHFEIFNTKSEAMKREYEIKKLTREQKIKIIKIKEK